MTQTRSVVSNYVKVLAALCFFLSINFSLNAQTFDFSTVTGSGTATLTQTVGGVTATVTRSSGSNILTAGAIDGNACVPDGLLVSTESITFTFSSPVDISSFQIIEYATDPNNGSNYVFTPNTGSVVSIADNAAELAANFATISPADWTGVTSIVCTYNPASSAWQLAFDSIVFTPTATAPTITSATYNYSANELAVTGENFVGNAGENNDVDISTLTILGEGGNSYTLSSSSDVEISSATLFIVNLSGADITNVEGLLNMNGAQSVGGTSYNLSAADDWMTGVADGDISDGTNTINVTNFINPIISSVDYDFTGNTLAVTGANFVNNFGPTNDVDVSAFTIRGEGGNSYTLSSSSNIEVNSSTSFTIALSGADIPNVEALLNKNGTQSVGGTSYNLSVADDWMAGVTAGDISDGTTSINVSNYALPNITSATYDYNTNIMTVDGTNFVSNNSGDDVDVSKFQIDNGNGQSISLVLSAGVEITSATRFSFTVSGENLPRLEFLLNKNGTTCEDGTAYGFLANDDWMKGIVSGENIADFPNELTVSNYAVPAISSVEYNYGTNVLTFTGTDFVNNPFVVNDVDVSLFTVKGEGGGSYSLSTTGDVEILNSTTFSILLSGMDIPNVEALLNNNGNSSATSSTLYNLGAAEDWMISSPSINDIADATSGILVSGYANPGITNCTYNAGNGTLVLNGTNLVISSGANNDVDVSLLRFGGEGANEYTLTNTSDVDITSATSATIILSAEDKLFVNGLLNKNGTNSGDLTAYNLAASDNWMKGSPASFNITDGTAPITVAGVVSPTITSATFDYSSAQFVVTATNLAHKPGLANDIIISAFNIIGEGGAAYTLNSTTDVEVTSSTEFTINLSGSDIYNVKSLLNKNGTASVNNTVYNFAAADDWAAAADASAAIADIFGNQITVSSFANPVIASATYDAGSGQLIVNGTDFVGKSAANDIDASLFTITGGQGGETYTLANTADVELTSGTQFNLTLSEVDRLNVNGLLNKNNTLSAGGITYNLSAAEDWMTGSPVDNTIADMTLNGITVSNVSIPTITSAVYNSDTGVFVVTGTNFFKVPGLNNDVDLSKLTITGSGGGYPISDAITDVEITSATEFTFTVTGMDKLQVDARLDQFGTVSSLGTTYNIAGADNWLVAADPSINIADLTGNLITVQITPKITNAVYNASTGVLDVTGSNIQANSEGADIDASKFTITAEGGETYTLTNTPDVERTSALVFQLTLSDNDKGAVNQIINQNGTTSTDATSYNLAAADDWCTNVTAENTEDLNGNQITVGNVAIPTISSTTYNAATGDFVVNGTGLSKRSGLNNDIDISKFVISGEGAETYTLTDTVDVDITNGLQFSFTLTSTDRAAVNQIINKNGLSSTGGTTYNIAAAEDWARGAEESIAVADLTLNGINVTNVPIPVIASSSYNWSDGILTATGSGFTKRTGDANDVDASKFTFKGEGGGTYTLIGSADVEIISGTEFAVTLDATDKAAVNLLLNKEGTKSNDNVAYNLEAADDWALGADVAVNVGDAITGITAGNFNTPPAGADDVVTIFEDITHTFATSDFTFNDPDGDNLGAIKLETLETAGELKYNGADAVTGIDYTDISLLKFTPDQNLYGSDYSSFTFKVKDDRGAYSVATYTMTINVTNVNDRPHISIATGFSIEEGGAYLLSNSNLLAWDVEDKDSSLVYNLTKLPDYGVFKIAGDSSSVSVFTQGDVSNSKVSYYHDGSDMETDTVKINVVDSGKNTSVEYTLVISVNLINDAPQLLNIETADINYIIGQGATSITSTLDVSDNDNEILNSATIAIGGYQAGVDKLSGENVEGISASFNTATGVLNLIGEAPVSSYQSALYAVKYECIGGISVIDSRKNISFTVSDSALSSTPVFRNIIVSLPPDTITTSIEPPDSISVMFRPDGHAWVRWVDKSDNELGFIILRNSSSAGQLSKGPGEFEILAIVGENVEEYKDTLTVEGESYSYKINVYNEEGKAVTDSVEIKKVLLPPSELTVMLKDNNSILNWKDNSSMELGFIVEKMTGNEFFPIDTLSENETSALDTNVDAGSINIYRVKAFNASSESEYCDTVSLKPITGVMSDLEGLPTEYSLSQNYPNPFNPVTIIRFGLPESGHVSLSVYDVLGRKVTTLIDEEKTIGNYQIEFNGINISSGIYYYRIITKNYIKTKKMLLLK